MTRSKKISIGVLAVILLASAAIAGSHFHESHSHEASHGDHGSHAGSGKAALILDAGNAKWKMDDHTRTSVGRIERIIAARKDVQDLPGLKGFGGEVSQELNILLQGCTMSGPAHEQLHVFLTLVLPKVESLKNAPGLEVARAESREIAELFHAFPQYFE